MGSLQSGGGTSAVAASAHAGCRRFRLTDAFLTTKTRKSLADFIGAPDTTAGIPEARWTRAMTFERLVHDERFVSELLTKTLGQLELPRPGSVARVNCKGQVEATAKALADADLKATYGDTATMISSLGIPYLLLEDEKATAVLPDFAIVAPRSEGGRVVGSWLIMGDAKDYERVRARIDDTRMLKGFLQVALGAESAAHWSKLPGAMKVHPSGALAVPRNAFLQPEAVIERLDDHREEVRGRAEERLAEKRKLGENRPTEAELSGYVEALEPRFDPRSCVSCNLFRYCREELRGSEEPADLLVEVGVPPRLRPAAAELLGGGAGGEEVPATLRDQVHATLSGEPVWRRRRRTDPVGSPGAIYVVVAKADSSALGIHGISVRRPGGEWRRRTFADPQAAPARRGTMQLIGQAVIEARDQGALPLHLIVPDGATADLLVSAADSVAGVELSRMRWARDIAAGRPALTFDGQPAKPAPALDEAERLGVAILLEQDRSRAMRTRSVIVDLRSILACHVSPGGPAIDALRLDYLLSWATATEPVAHREISDAISEMEHTPGARLANSESDRIWTASRGGDSDEYRRLVGESIGYKEKLVDRTEELLEALDDSRLRAVLADIEFDSQEVWWRRVALGALDLVRFSRTTEFWRAAQVRTLETDGTCSAQLEALVDPALAHERALDGGDGKLAVAKVVDLEPLQLEVRSPWFTDGVSAVALHVNGDPVIEDPDTTLKIQATSFKVGQLAIGELTGEGEVLEWTPRVMPEIAIGDELILADASWFKSVLLNGHELTVARPAIDKDAAPKPDCTPASYAAAPDQHRWCCRPHSIAEAETADYFAAKRDRGEMNPETWPPLIDDDRFDVGGAEPEMDRAGVPAEITSDDLD